MKKISRYFKENNENDNNTETSIGHSSAKTIPSSNPCSTTSTNTKSKEKSPEYDLPEKPNQPKSFCFPVKDQGKQKRSFRPHWFDEFTFLHYREQDDSVICHTCALADKRKLLTIDTRKEKIFLETGFSNWKKAIEKFRAHESSATHKHASEVLLKPTNIDELLSKNVASQKKENSRCLMKLLENIVFLGKQGMALR